MDPKTGLRRFLSCINWRSATAMVLTLIITASVFLPGAEAFAAVGAGKIKDKKNDAVTISIMGDSISTYTGWSDKYPITDETCTNRYGEAYYGPVGGDFHNTELLVTDTWWHQAATELGAEILMSNAGNSTGLLIASYPSNAAWDLYLKEMLAYKSRPHYLGTDTEDPDIIALYIGSNDIAKASESQFGSVDIIDFNNLCTANEDGSFSNITPSTVAEAYCILMEKISHLYPDAEVYCFAVVPNAGNGLSVFNDRLAKAPAFTKMVEDVAAHYGATVVNLIDAFGIDPDNDGVATQEDYDTFASYFHNDPHPNAAGFDVITEAFVSSVRKNSDLFVEVETKGGLYEAVPVTAKSSTDDEGNTIIDTSAKKYLTPEGYTVTYKGQETVSDGITVHFNDRYSSDRGRYSASGGREYTTETGAPQVELKLPITLTEDGQPVTSSQTVDATAPLVSGKDPKSSPDDGIYDYTITYGSKGGASVTTSSVSVSDTVADEDVNNLRYITNPSLPSESNDMLTNNVSILNRPKGPEEVPSIASGYDFIYIGSDQYSRFYAAHAHDYHREEFPNEKPFYHDSMIDLWLDTKYSVFHDRGLVVPRLYLQHTIAEFDKYVEDHPDEYLAEKNFKGFPARWESIQQFTLVDRTGDVITAYCADQNTPSIDGYCYRIVNVEDYDYYRPDSLQMLRTVAYNGYWGTDSGEGSLDHLKQKIVEADYLKAEDAARITDGIAMTATQYAIWNFSNAQDSYIFVNSYLSKSPSEVGSAADKDDTDLIFAIHRYLTQLTPMEAGNTSTDSIINKHNFLEDVAITIKEKPADNPANLDADDTNDVYLADIVFDFKFIPANAEGESLAMYVYDGETPIASGRISGETMIGDIQMTKLDDHRYLLPNVALTEGERNIRFALSGTQNLDKDVYLLISEEKNNVPSQNFVTIAEGPRDFHLYMDLTFELSVDDAVYSRERVWRTEKNKTTPPPTPTSPPPTFGIPKTGDINFEAALAEFFGI